MRTSGISLSRIALSVVVAGLLVSILTLAVNEGVVPPAEDRYRAAFTGFLEEPTPIERQQVLFREQSEDGIESVYYVRRFLTDAGRMEGVVVNQFEGGQLVRIIEAPEARYLNGAWIFRSGTMYWFTGSTTVTQTFDRLRVGLRRTPKEIALPQKEPSEMTIRELRAYISVLRRSGDSTARYIAELQSKIAFPLSAMLFSLLAVPLGLRPHRSGTSIGLGLTIVVLVAYYILISITLTLGQGGRLHPVAAAWLPNVVLAAAGIILLRRADR